MTVRPFTRADWTEVSEIYRGLARVRMFPRA